MFKAAKLIRPALFGFLAVVLAMGFAQAQSGRKPDSPTSQDQEQTIRLRAEEVLLNITVTDPYGHQATDLTKDEFIVAEDGQRQDVASFLMSTVPVNVVLMLDASGSIISEIPSLRDAAMQFVNKLRPEDRVSVVEFHSKVELIQDWTANAEDVRHALSWRFKPGMVQTKDGRFEYGSTALYDSLYSTAEELLSKVEGRKAIIMLTDGDDTTSKVTYEQATASIVRSGAVVYVVSKARAFISILDRNYRGKVSRVFGGSNGQVADVIVARLERAEFLMTELCKRTGGQIFSPLKDEEMKEVYASVARELKNQYSITYISKNEKRDGTLRRVGVFLTRPGYTSRTRESYYAPRK